MAICSQFQADFPIQEFERPEWKWSQPTETSTHIIRTRILNENEIRTRQK